MTDGIYGFFGQYRWLSNFHLANVSFDGVTYISNEHAYQAAKTLNHSERRWFSDPTTDCRKAKRLGSVVTMQPNWDTFKFSVMKHINYQKYANHDYLKEMLLNTGDTYLEETNTWGDTYWGVCNGNGQNNLGKILMDIRTELRVCSSMVE